MSGTLFRCLSSSSARDLTGGGEAAADVPAPACDRGGRKQQRRSRSVVTAFLALFRSQSPVEKAPAPAQTPPLDAEKSHRRARHATAACAADTAGRPPNSRMKLKRDRCPKCHGVLPLSSSGPELPPVLVRPGQGRQRRDYKEDSGCIMTEAKAGGSRSRARSPESSRARPSQEDSGNYSLSSSAAASHQASGPPLPRPPGLAYSRCAEFTTCVPRIPNRDAPVNCAPIRG